MKKKFLFAGIFFALFVALIVLVKTFDVAAIGPNGSEIGLSRANHAFFEFFGQSDKFDKFTDILVLLAIAVCGVFAALGGFQLLKRKDLKKVDKEIFALGGLYAIVGVLYVLFEKVVINYRPMIESVEEGLEASFPSSHTMLTCVVMGSAAMLAAKYIANKNMANMASVTCWLVAVLMVIGRMMSGRHWFTDILGAVLLSGALLTSFSGVLERLRSTKKK